MSDTPKKDKAAVVIAIAVAAAAGYLGHDPLRQELMTAGIYGREPAIVAPPPRPPSPPVLLKQEAVTQVVYDGEHGPKVHGAKGRKP